MFTNLNGSQCHPSGVVVDPGESTGGFDQDSQQQMPEAYHGHAQPKSVPHPLPQFVRSHLPPQPDLFFQPINGMD